MAKEINLSQGKVAIVDDADFAELSRSKWFVTANGYAIRNIRTGLLKYTNETMHRVIMNPPAGMDVDHINGNKLDNRRANLRICTRSQNLRNSAAHSDNASGFKGVSWFKPAQRWKARIWVDNKEKHLGYFDTPEAAALAYNEAAKKYHGEYARLNEV